MLRGFRWQLVAFVSAAVLFTVSLLLRAGDTPAGVVTPAPDPTSVLAEATQAPTTAVDMSATLPAPTAQPMSADGVTTFREALVGRVQRLNPLFAGLNPVDRDITSLIFEGLTRTNQYGEPEGALAESWVVSSDGLEYIIRLRQDVLWQDGTPFTADDVVYTMGILRSPEFPGPTELGEFWRTVETEKLDTYLVRFRLTQPLGSFLNMLRIGMLPVHALQGTGAAQLATHPFNLSPIGTGPYQLEAFRSEDGSTITAIDLRAAPVYRQRPEGASGFAIDRLSFRLFDEFDAALAAFQNGEVDGLAGRERQERRPLLALETTAPTEFRTHTAVQPELGLIIFNWDNDFFQEQRVRVALETGIDRTSVVERNLSNEAVMAESPIMPGSWAHIGDLAWPAYDPVQARTLLATALERIERIETTEAATAEATAAVTEEADSNTVFDFEILVPEDQGLVPMAQELATQWSQYSLGVSVAAVDLPTYQTRLEAGDFDAALVELSLGDSADPDVYDFWHQGQHPDGKNYGGVNDRRISEVLERARQEYNGINRMEYYRRFQEEFVDRAIAIPMYYPLFTYVVAAHVEGVQLGFIGSPSDRFRNIRDWAITG